MLESPRTTLTSRKSGKPLMRPATAGTYTSGLPHRMCLSVRAFLGPEPSEVAVDNAAVRRGPAGQAADQIGSAHVRELREAVGQVVVTSEQTPSAGAAKGVAPVKVEGLAAAVGSGTARGGGPGGGKLMKWA